MSGIASGMRLATIVVALAALAACFTGETIRHLRGGESREDVERVMGSPDGYRREGNVEALTYANRLMSGWGWDRADYHVLLTNGRVSTYGPGTVRQQTSPFQTLILVPVR